MLFETYSEKNGEVAGYTRNYIKVRCKGEKDLINQIKEVKLLNLIETNDDYEMKGEIIDELR